MNPLKHIQKTIIPFTKPIVFVLLVFACQFPVAAEELTVAEQADRETIVQIRKNFEEKLKAIATQLVHSILRLFQQ